MGVHNFITAGSKCGNGVQVSERAVPPGSTLASHSSQNMLILGFCYFKPTKANASENRSQQVGPQCSGRSMVKSPGSACRQRGHADTLAGPETVRSLRKKVALVYRAPKTLVSL